METGTRTEMDLQLGDCLYLLPRLETASVDVVVTSPPYNIGAGYSTYDDRSCRHEFLDWCVAWGTELRRVLKENGSLFLNIGAPPSNPLLPHQIALRFSDFLVLQNTFHWIKSISLPWQGETVSLGHYKPLNSNRYVHNAHEYIFHFTPDGRTPLRRLALGVPYQDKSNIARWAHTGKSDRRCRGNTWFIPYTTIRDRSMERPHPATFPTDLPRWCLRLHGAGPGHCVLDPFLGLGSSGLAACEEYVGIFRGMEIDPIYWELARQRLLPGDAVAPHAPLADIRHDGS